MTPLLRSARAGDLAQVEKQVSKGVDVNRGNAFDWTALMFAAGQGNEAMVVRLLDAGADPNRMSKRIARNTQGPTAKTTALAQATKNNHLAIARLLMARGAEVDSISVALAAGLEDLSLLKEMLDGGADMNQTAGVIYVGTPLITACRAGKLENVQWLVTRGVEVSRDALALAAVHRRYEISAYLLSENKKRNLFTEEDKSFALFWSAIREDNDYDGHQRIVKLLLDHGANPDFRTSSSSPKNLTAAEYLKQRREQDGHQRYVYNRGPQYREQQEKLYAHRSALIGLLKKAEAKFQASTQKGAPGAPSE